MGGCCSKDGDLAWEQGEKLYEDNVEEEDHDDDGGGVRVRLGGPSRLASMFTQQGWKGVNQDAMTLWEGFAGSKDDIFCGVFDGHGPLGHKVAGHVRDVLPSKLSAGMISYKKNNGDHDYGIDDDGDDDGSNSLFSSWKATFIKAFEELDVELSQHSTIDCICSGTTAVSIVKQRKHLIIANLGDSRAVLGTRDDRNQLVPIQLTVDQKPNVPSEAERIRSCEGRVFALEEEPDVHRLWLPDEDCPGLAMARAFGDFCLKDFGLISTPQVFYRKLSPKDEFVVLASDGVWDVLSNNEVIKIVSTAKKSDAAAAAKMVVKRAIRAWKTRHPTSKVDDCAVICLFLKAPPSAAAKSAFLAHGCRTSAKCSELSSFESFETAEIIAAVRSKAEWTALEGVSRVNSLVRLPRRKRSVKLVGDDSR